MPHDLLGKMQPCAGMGGVRVLRCQLALHARASTLLAPPTMPERHCMEQMQEPHLARVRRLRYSTVAREQFVCTDGNLRRFCP